MLDDLAGADGEERLPAAAGAGGAADVGEGERGVVEAEDGEVGAGAGREGADFAGEAERGGGTRGGCLECGGLGHAGGDQLGDRARQVVLGHGAEMALVDIGGDGVGREAVGQAASAVLKSSEAMPCPTSNRMPRSRAARTSGSTRPSRTIQPAPPSMPGWKQ